MDALTQRDRLCHGFPRCITLIRKQIDPLLGLSVSLSISPSSRPQFHVKREINESASRVKARSRFFRSFTQSRLRALRREVSQRTVLIGIALFVPPVTPPVESTESRERAVPSASAEVTAGEEAKP